MVYNFLLALLLIFITIIAVYNYSSLESIQPYLEQIKSSYNEELIYSISLANSVESCPSDTKPLVLGTYYGTNQGCINKNEITKGQCGIWNKVLSACQDINEAFISNINTIFGSVLCVKTNKFNYTEMLNENMIINNTKECQIGKKKCGIIDTNSNIYCVDEKEECPVNGIRIDNYNLREDYISIPFNRDGMFLHYTNKNTDSKILTTSFKISEGFPCVHPYEINTNFRQYILDKVYDNYTCRTNISNYYTDPRYTQIVSINKESLYKENNIPVFLLSNYTHYTLNTNVQLYSLNYIGINEKCNFNLNYESNLSLINISNAMHYILMPYVRFCVTFYIFSTFVKILKFWNFDHFTFRLDYILMILLFLCCILAAFSYIMLRMYNTINSSCAEGDEILSRELEWINETINNSKRDDLIMISFSIACIVLVLVSMMIGRYGLNIEKKIKRFGEKPKEEKTNTSIEMKEKIQTNSNISISDITKGNLIDDSTIVLEQQITTSKVNSSFSEINLY